MPTRLLFLSLLVISLVCSACQQTFRTVDQGEPVNPLLTVAYAEPLDTLSPLSYEAKNRKYLSSLYEPLVRFDSTFNIDSSLAVSWGRLDDTTWDFHLRRNVYFHDGRTFTAADAVYSLNLARGDTSELRPLLSTISSVTQSEDDRLTIVTNRPDPLLLNRLTYVFVFPEGTTDFSLPVGTGPYRVQSLAAQDLTLERFPDYWGPAGFFPEAALSYLPDPDERLDALLKGQVQVLANVPPQSVDELEAAGITVKDFPSLEVSYLVLNQRRVFADANLREAVSMALSSDYTKAFGGGYLMPTSQYAATGIEGYHSDAALREQNVEKAKELRALHEGAVSVNLDVPQGVEQLGSAIAADLAQIDILVTVNGLSASELQDKIQGGTSDMYFFGWKYDLADSEDFLEAAVHSKMREFGQFNGAGYADATLDALIEKAATALKLVDRRTAITAVQERLNADAAIVPLFESKTLYGFHTPTVWNLRLDGQLFVSDFSEK